MRSKKLRFLSFLYLFGALLLCFFLLSGTALAETWVAKSTGGFGDPYNLMAMSMAVYNSSLYVGTYSDTGSGGQGCEVWRYDGLSWTHVVGQSAPGTPGTGPGFGDINNSSAHSLAVLGSYLYVGTENDNGCQVWRYDGTSWNQMVGQGTAGTPTGPGFGNVMNIGVHSMAADGIFLFAGTNNDIDATGQGCEVWRYDGTNWTQVVGQSPPGTPGTGPGFGDKENGCAHSMAFLGSHIYAGTYNSFGCEVWRYDGDNWSQLVGQGAAGTSTGPGFGDTNNITAWSMAMFDGAIYVGTEYRSISLSSQGSDQASSHATADARVEFEGNQFHEAAIGLSGPGCQVWRNDGSNWTQVVGQGSPGTPTGPGFGDSNNFAIYFLTVYNDMLYAGTANLSVGCQVWRYDRSGWIKVNQDAFGRVNAIASCMAHFYDNIFIGTGNPYGCEVWALPYTFYFAEGHTSAEFREYLCVGNPFGAVAHVSITYLFPDGTTQPQIVEVQPNSRTTVPVNQVVGNDRDVSCKLESDLPIVAERPMYFNYNGLWNGGHDAVGATGTSTTWYFAEGYTGTGFDEWICVLNPQDRAAELTFHFQTQEEGLKDVTGLSVPAHSRQTFKVNNILGNNYQTSLKLESTVPVVAERPMYFSYQGTNAWEWTGGHCVMGTPSLAKEYSFAEGTTREGFEEWLTLQNPSTDPITINATYQLGAGQGPPVPKSYTVGAGRRETIYVPKEVGTEKDVSVLLSSTSDFLAERPMYFRYTAYGADWTGGHCVIGAFEPVDNWFFAEGYTGDNFQEWLCLQNQFGAPSLVEIDYYTQEGGALEPRQVEVPALTRMTIRVNESAGPNLQLSMRVKVLSGPAIVAERPMYFNYDGVWSGGHDVVGYAP